MGDPDHLHTLMAEALIIHGCGMKGPVRHCRVLITSPTDPTQVDVVPNLSLRIS